MELFLLVVIALLLLPNLYVAGFHDIPNALALPVRTGAVTAKGGTRLAALCNAAGALLTIPLGIYAFTWFEFPQLNSFFTFAVLISALLTVLGWNILTYRMGMPTSTTHALLGALFGGSAGALWVSGSGLSQLGHLPWFPVLVTVLVAPTAVFVLGYVGVSLANLFSRGEDPYGVNRVCRGLEAVSVGVLGLGIGIQQGQRFGFVMLTALIAADVTDTALWMLITVLISAIGLAAGAFRGGWRIGHTIGHRLVEVDPLRGMVTTTSTSAVVWLAGMGLGLPVSTSLTAVSALIGAGAHQQYRTVHWPQVLTVLRYWLLTPLVCMLSAGVLTAALSPLF